jgi:hypothetical protein
MHRHVLLSLLLPAVAGLVACAAPPSSPAEADAEAAWQPALLRGSAETPDPVLARVRELERAGVVRDVVVHESFPVQIRLRASAQTLAELQALPRKGGIDEVEPGPGN